MGHERIPALPKTQKWRDVVQQIASIYTSETEVADIAKQTIQIVRSRLRQITRDDGVKAAFQFLVNLSVASRSENPQEYLLDIGIELPNSPTPLSFAKAVKAWMAPKINSLEYGRIAQGAATDAISIWYNQNKTTQGRLFESLDDPFEVWRKAGNGAGFCELSRLFFARFTERYLSYFLEREASAVLEGIHERNEFRRQLEEHVEEISQHAFETAKITQSFAAGWFNKHAREGIPDEKAIEGFLSIAFGKIRDELLREGQKQ